jgi:nucleoside-diphosphate-sugar epimerase
MDWKAHRVLVTGGASFIGSHLTDALVARGARVRIIDDLGSGRVENLQGPSRHNRVEFIRTDLLRPGVAQRAVEAMDVVFHLAANHRSRGYLEMHQAAFNLLSNQP